ncbi:hypothetical protein STVIR_1934 [Streptomyces viridochromogenes Tue57]|uniref:Uncharacterized protein n=1 Tax=Streptomyces viridochromogenes Tue57 TaxID=1160705 RepID=L8PLC8_STRVR|nr:hypothetical protein STVIR_1934 [Streptomyces viridochromogenes Tue57]
MHVVTLEQTLRERHPTMADRVSLGDSEGRTFLRVDLTSRQSVVLLRCRLGHAEVWMIEDPDLDSAPSVWPVTTPDDVLVDAVHAVASAHLAGVPLASPWRWHESEPSEATELADLLDAQGVRVLRVAASNRYYPYGPRHAPKLDVVGGRGAGAILEAEFSEAFVRVSLKPALGWTVDVHSPDWYGWSRIDLGWCLRGRSSPVPGMPTTQVSVREIAELLCRGPRAWDIESAWRPPRPDAPLPSVSTQALQEPLFTSPPDQETAPDWFTGFLKLWEADASSARHGTIGSLSASDVAGAVLEQLTDLGFADVREGSFDNPIESDLFHIIWHSGRKSLSISEVQKLNGLAAAAGEDVPKRLIVITGTGLTRPAADFADEAKAFAYYLDRATGGLSAENSRAYEAQLPGRGPVRRELEPW